MSGIKPAEVSEILKKELEGLTSISEFEEVGVVLEVGDGIARIYGLTNVQSGELIEFSRPIVKPFKVPVLLLLLLLLLFTHNIKWTKLGSQQSWRHRSHRWKSKRSWHHSHMWRRATNDPDIIGLGLFNRHIKALRVVRQETATRRCASSTNCSDHIFDVAL